MKENNQVLRDLWVAPSVLMCMQWASWKKREGRNSGENVVGNSGHELPKCDERLDSTDSGKSLNP